MPVPYERASAVVVDAGALLCVRLRDPMTGARVLSPPGGGVERGETGAAAAVRETLEETGHRIAVDADSARRTQYLYTWAGRTADVTCWLFRGRLLGARADAVEFVADPIQEAVVWVPLTEVGAALGYLPVFAEAVLALALALANDGDGGGGAGGKQ